MPGVFISYRNGDVAHAAGRLHAELVHHYGRSVVHRDKVFLTAGDRWWRSIVGRIRSSDVVLPVIGPSWLAARSGGSGASIDYMEMEIEVALRAGVQVIPILVDDTEMPDAGDLPPGIRSISSIQALRLRDDAFEEDLEELKEKLNKYLSNNKAIFDRIIGRLRSPVAFAFGAVGLASSLVGLWQFVDQQRPSPPSLEVMSGEFNVVIADLTERSEEENSVSVQSRSFSSALGDDLVDGFSQGSPRQLQVEVLRVGADFLIDSADSNERAGQARTLAELVNADMVIYGSISFDGTLPDRRTEIVPEFYLTPRAVPDALELVGAYRFGVVRSPFDVSQRPEERPDIFIQLDELTRQLIQFSSGLMQFRGGQYSGALQTFQSLGEDGDWPTDAGPEIVPLFVGNMQGILGDLDLAEEAYTHSLDFRPRYGRALVGLAEVRFQRARGQSCVSGANREGLIEAARGFEALSATANYDAPVEAQIEAKALLGVARVDLCMAAVERDDLDRAVGSLERVIEAYRSDDSLRGLAAEAYANLGFAQDIMDLDQEAISSFAEAAHLTESLERKAEWSRWRARLLVSQCQFDTADEVFSESITAYNLALEQATESFIVDRLHEGQSATEHDRQAASSDRRCR